MTGVSVVLPVRDVAAYLHDSLSSLANQTMDDFEAIVVDDGSRDGTPDVVRAWTERDRRFRLVRTGPLGLVEALRMGLREARSPYTARMDGDDVCHPERLAEQRAFLEAHPELAGCGTGVRYFPEEAVTEGAVEYAAWLNGMTRWDLVERSLFIECPLAHPTFMFRTEVLAAVGGYRDRGWPEDYDLLLRLWRCGHRFVSLPRVLLDWRVRAEGASRSGARYSLDAFRQCRVHHLLRSHLSGGRRAVVWGSGPTGKSLARELLRQGAGVEAFVDVDERKIGQTIHGAPVHRAPWGAHLEGVLHIGAVARAEGRGRLREMAAGAGLVDGMNFLAMA